MQLYRGYLPEDHPTLLRLQFSMAQELRKLGREADAKFAENEARQFATRFSDSSVEPIYQQDAEFLMRIADQKQTPTEKNALRHTISTTTRPMRHWAD